MQPKKLGRYEILEELGRGAMGRVLLAYDPQIDRKVAIKILRGFEAEGEEARQRFLGEARSAGKLLHPGIVTLFDVGEADGLLYLAMEAVRGETLDRYRRKDRLLPVPTVLELIASAADALHYAHGMGIVHRDIKPANLMRTGETSIKIMDFGLAGGAEAGRTGDDALLGTPSYLSPEQIRGETIDGRSDLFSLGVVLHELIHGAKPFPGDSVASIIYRIVNEEPDRASAAPERATPKVEALLRAALAKRPGDRFQSGEELARALRAAAGSAAGAVASSTTAGGGGRPGPAGGDREIPPGETNGPRRTSPLPFIVGIVAVLVAAAAGVYYYGSGRGWFEPRPPAPVFHEATVRADPPQAEVFLDGEPLEGATVRFESGQPPPLLRAEYRCRGEEHRLTPADDGTQVDLVLQPAELRYELAGAPAPASVELNGAAVGTPPLDLELDLCRPNTLVLRAEGYREDRVEIPEGATPLEARTRLAAIEWTPIPKGTLVLPGAGIELVRYVDGRRLGSSERELELPEGPHRLRVKNEAYWIDVTREVAVVAGERVTPELDLPPLATLVVLAYPPNCTVDVRRPGGSWRYLDDVPVRRKLASGRYEVRVTLKPTGETRTREIELAAGKSPEIRVSFGRAS